MAENSNKSKPSTGWSLEDLGYSEVSFADAVKKKKECKIKKGNSAEAVRLRTRDEILNSINNLIDATGDDEITTELEALKAVIEKIYARVEECPEMEKDIKDYNSVYFPEVLRLTGAYNEKIAGLGTETYAQSDDAAALSTESNSPKIDFDLGEKTRKDQADKIKQDLLKLIDNVIEASENLIDKLYEDDVMDITVDIQAIRTKIASEGLLDSDFNITL